MRGTMFFFGKLQKSSDVAAADDVNSSVIRTYGTKHLTLDLGLRRSFPWTFVIADASRPILHADFMERFESLIEIKNRRLIDKLTSLKVNGKTCSCPSIGLTTIVADFPYHILLLEFPNITKPALNCLPVNHSTNYCILTTGPPVCNKPRRLSPEKLKALKTEFKSLLEQGILRPSKNPWASPMGNFSIFLKTRESNPYL
ncbi:hypothetical protein AVEN_52771-1 [Araneus ventricosus]|uniref:Uncharacterized protein n=1 Tax=Araneus ventricosus TaxID=182803 RepID=A0A4Y2CXP7_ARAVE|nr:hypothetical protein AVEN_52771-1 [Araneus ventricosus]